LQLARVNIAATASFYPLAKRMATHYLDGGGATYDIFSGSFATFQSNATSYIRGLNLSSGQSASFYQDWSGFAANQTADSAFSLNSIYYGISGSATRNSDGTTSVSLTIKIHDYYDFTADVRSIAGVGMADYDWYWLAVTGLAVPYNVTGSYRLLFTIPE
jgi:hypothetical protein